MIVNFVKKKNEGGKRQKKFSKNFMYCLNIYHFLAEQG